MTNSVLLIATGRSDASIYPSTESMTALSDICFEIKKGSLIEMQNFCRGFIPEKNERVRTLINQACFQVTDRRYKFEFEELHLLDQMQENSFKDEEMNQFLSVVYSESEKSPTAYFINSETVPKILFAMKQQRRHYIRFQFPNFFPTGSFVVINSKKVEVRLISM